MNSTEKIMGKLAGGRLLRFGLQNSPFTHSVYLSILRVSKILQFYNLWRNGCGWKNVFMSIFIIKNKGKLI